MKRVLAALALCVAGTFSTARAAVVYTVDPAATWLGYMNVFELPSNGGGYVFGQGWGVADLCATFSGPVLTLAPNSVNDPDPFWYSPVGGSGSTGNKNMDANVYQEITDTLAGQAITFTGNVISNTFTSAHSSVAFIKDFAPDYSSMVPTTVPLTTGIFSVNYTAINAPGRHIQFGFETMGPDVWSTDVAPYGSIQVTAVPEPSTLLVTVGGTALLGLRRRQIR